MEQHAVPQNISSYEFRLVGDMTLKQFFQLAGGIILGVVFFRLPIPAFIKYPLVFISVMGGILMAFVPINGRPFTAWITAFFRAIYAPTEFTWAPDTEIPTASNIAPTIQKVSPIQSTAHVPDLPPVAPVATPVTAPVIVPEVPKISPIPTSTSIPTPKPTPPSDPFNRPLKTTETTFSSFVPTTLSVDKGTLSVPPTPPTQKTETPPAPTSVVQPKVDTQPITVGPVFQPLKNIPTSTPAPQPTTSSAQPATNLVSTPTQPNVLAGMVTDKSGAAIESAIVEIIDSVTQIPARALRTNRTGLFQIVTPLKPSTYQINVEKEGFSFPSTTFKAEDKIIPPVIIKAA